MNQENRGIKLAQLVARCRWDESLRKKLLADPMATLKAEGIEMPAGMAIRVHENTGTEFHLVLPAISATELSDLELDVVSGGTDTAQDRVDAATAAGNEYQRTLVTIRNTLAKDDSSGTTLGTMMESNLKL